MKLKSYLITGAVVVAVALCGQGSALAASKKSAAASPAASASPGASAAASPSAKAARAIPFRGTVSAVDASAKTFTITGKSASRVFKVTDTTTVTKDGAAATFADIAAEGKVSGSYLKQADGTMECKSVKVGGKADASSEKKSKKGEAGAAASAAPSASPSASAAKK